MNIRAMRGLSLVLIGGAVGLAAFAAEDPPRADMDKPITDFKLMDVSKELKPGESKDAAMVSLASYKGKKNVVLFFMSEKCGTTWKYEKRVGEMLKDQKKQDTVWLGVRCSAADTPQSLCKWADTRNFSMPVINDEKGALTRYFNLRNTPGFVLIDKQGALRYKGAFDDNADEKAVEKKYLADAIGAVLNGKDVPVKTTRPLG